MTDLVIKELSLHFPLILFFAFLIVWIVITYKVGDWQNWRHYYPTILFFWCGDLIYNVLFCEKPLWQFKNAVFSHELTDIICMFIVFTCTVLMYIPWFPKTFKKQVLYIGYWVLLYTGIEWLFHTLGGITYHNGWSVKLSLVHNIYQFLLLKLHHHKPILAWVLALIILVLVASSYKIDVTAASKIMDRIHLF